MPYCRSRLMLLPWCCAIHVLSSCSHLSNHEQIATPDKPITNSDDLLIVDCLLPGQVRQLGTRASFLTARRPIKTSAADCKIRGGEYVAFDRANYASALKTWLPLAQSGNAEAQTYVGEIYEKGLGITADYTAAALWYQRAAKQNFSRAQINLGNLYEQGLGVATDKRIALNWYRKASGLNTDNLDYATTVKVNAQERQELDNLRERVAQQDNELTHLSSQLTKTRHQLRDNERALKQASNGIASSHKQSVLKQSAPKQPLPIENKTKKIIAPSIEIIDPPMGLMRGVPTIRLRSGTRHKEIVGKITAPAGLKSFTINGKPVPVDQYQLFWANIPINAVRNKVHLRAQDKDNQETALELALLADQKHQKRTTAAPNPQTPQATNKTTSLNINDDINLGRYHALVIGNNQYKHYPKLKTAINDAAATASILREKFGVKTTLLTNANRFDILSALNSLRAQLTATDNLIIYYAGHGDIDDDNQRGFWLPVDAKPNDKSNWISNTAVSDILNSMAAKHILVVADSCYAGTLSQASLPRLNYEMAPEKHADWVKAMVNVRARTVLSSGGVAPVLDGGSTKHSVFSGAFLNALESTEGVVEGHAIYRAILNNVRQRSKALQYEQIPDYAPARFAGHEAGEFFFKAL